MTDTTWTEEEYAERGVLGMWKDFHSIVDAMAGGYTQYFHPSGWVDPGMANKYMEKLEKGWLDQSRGRYDAHKYDGSPEFTKLPDNAKAWLYERIHEEKKNPIYQKLKKEKEEWRGE